MVSVAVGYGVVDGRSLVGLEEDCSGLGASHMRRQILEGRSLKTAMVGHV